jgi:hypothetical protein
MTVREHITMNFTLDDGLIVTDEEARKLIVKRLPRIIYKPSLEHRKVAAARVTAPDSGHYGYTVSALAREARDIILFELRV